MLIPIGFFGAGGASPAYELIETVLATGSQTSITFSSIPQTYKHLQLRIVAKNNNGSNSQGQVRYNNDSSFIYTSHQMVQISGGVQSQMIGQNSFYGQVGVYSNNSDSTNFAPSIMDILDYRNTGKNRTAKILNGLVGSLNRVFMTSHLYRSTSAVTSITFLMDNGATLSTDSRFSLYGIKG
jgi:hypothetical protein